MIRDVEMRTEPIGAGEVRELRVHAAEPVQVEIHCRVYKPPPERWAGCPECGSFQLRSGEPLLFQASDKAFKQGGGALVISITDAKGDMVEFRLEVANWENPATGGKTNPPATVAPAGGSAREPARVASEEESAAQKIEEHFYQASR